MPITTRTSMQTAALAATAQATVLAECRHHIMFIVLLLSTLEERAMSAAKLEKKIWNLEQRLRQEFHVELRRAVGQCVARVQHLEAEVLLLRGEKPSRTGAQVAAQDQVSVDVSGDAPLPGAVAEKTQEADVLPVPRPSWPEWPEWEPNEAVAKDECVDWVPLEPVAFLESTWNLVLVMGFTDAGWLDIIIACLLLIASAGLQIAFSIILLSPDFLGQPFESHIQSAESWRVGVAHDYRHALVTPSIATP